eukprot:10617824-Alexandrium_andersonii.AAC.1
MSDAEPAELEPNAEDVDAEMFVLLNVMDSRSEEGVRGPSVRAGKPPKEAVDLARALFAAGATPGEVRAT